VFAVLTLIIARPVAFLVALGRSDASWGGRLLISWFGPRGLNSLLLLILAVSEGIPNSDRVFGIISVVVLASIIVHGTSATPLAAWYGRRAHRDELPEETLVDAGFLLSGGNPDGHVIRMLPEELKHRLDENLPTTLLDVRRLAAYEASGRHIPGSIRMTVDEIPGHLDEIPRDRPVVLSCA
jgi:hypothetical protein